MVNFSKFPPYDKSIPTISHIFDNSWPLYEFYNLPFFQRKKAERMIRRILNDSHSIIVPNISIGRELVEIFDISEERIEVTSFFPFVFSSEQNRVLPSFLDNQEYFLYDWWYGATSNIVNLLVEWWKYARESEAKVLLILLWLAWESLSLLTQTLRAFDLSEYVKYLWYQMMNKEILFIKMQMAGYIYENTILDEFLFLLLSRIDFRLFFPIYRISRTK